MEKVTVTREFDGTRRDVLTFVEDVEAFTRAAGFDRVTVDGDVVEVANEVGPKEIQLTLEVFDDEDAALALRQTEGLFGEMETRYYVEASADGCLATAETEFALDVSVIGGFLDATVIKIQRTRELEAQWNYVERQVTER